MNEQTRKEMQRKLADYRQPAPDISWDKLEAALAANRAAAATGTKAKTVMMWGKRLAVAAVVLLLAGIGWQMMKHDTNVTHSPIVAHKIATSTKSKGQPQPVVAQVSHFTKSDAIIPVSPRVHHLEPHIEVPTEEAVVSTTEEQTVTQEPSSTDSHTDVQRSTPRQHNAVTYPSDSRHHSQVVDSKLTAKAYLSNSLAGSNSSHLSTPMMLAANPYGPYHDDMNGNDNEPLNDQQAEIEENVRHHQPIHLGLSLRYQFSSHWSIEGGLSYTCLGSDITQKMNGSAYSISQQLHYVGVPVNVNYQLLGSRRFNVYMSAGVIVEKMVKGQRDIQAIYDNQTAVDYTEHVSIRPLQFSLTGAAGAEFKLDKNFSIYAEPGLVYHVDNHSSVPTIYDDKPLSFNLNMGLRFYFSNLK